MTAPRKKPTKANRTGAAVQAFIDPDIRAAMDAYIADHNAKQEHRASVTSTLEASLKSFLAGKGFWPWPPSVPPPARPRGG